MSREFKYVIIDGLFPRICSLAESHSDLVKFEGTPVTSAGKASLGRDMEGKITVSCWGESIGLRVKSDPTFDEELILRMFIEPSYSYNPPVPPQGAPFDEPLPPPPS